MRNSRDRLFIAASVALLVAITGLPYLAAGLAGGAEHVFAGFLLNPLDGNSYLAKMTAGWQGDWLFHLPFTAEQGEGHFLFVFYLFLGRLGRELSLPLVLTFHLARLAGAAVMVWALEGFFRDVLPGRRVARLACLLAAFGSGLGWLALPFGRFPSDFWVAEAYPFLSAYANPHFPLGLALVLRLLTPGGSREAKRWPSVWAARAGTLLASLALALILPFGVVVVTTVLAGWLAVEAVIALRSGRAAGEPRPFSPGLQAFLHVPGERLLAMLVGGVPLLVYDLWITRSDPLLAGWNHQNLTPSPAGWDLLLSLSPALLLAVPGFRAALRNRAQGPRLLAAWLVASAVLLYLPLGLQRRFILGVYIPAAGLAALGVDSLAGSGAPGRRRLLAAALLLLSLPTNLVVLLAARHGIQTRDAQLYLTRGEAQALGWLQANTPAETLVMAAPETGLLIPAHSGRRVIYGHPFETVNAAAEKAAVEDFWKDGGQPRPLLLQRGVDVLFVGPRERQLNANLDFPDLDVLYQAGDVTLYAAPPAP